MPRNTTARSKVASFAGIDYHKKFSLVSLGDSEGKLLAQHKLVHTDVETVRAFFSQHPGIQCAIESSRGYEWLLDLLREEGIEVKVANTYGVRLIADSRRKTDKIDSKILMELLAKGFLPTCYQPSKAERELRERLRWRVSLVRSRTQYKNKAHSLMDKENKGTKLSSRKARRNARTRDEQLTPARQELLDANLEVINFFEKEVAAQDRWIAECATNHVDAKRLMTIPGVGPISALMLVAELGDVSRFKKSFHAAAYLGLVPAVYSSADTRRTGPITKRGSARLRWILVQDAWMAIARCKTLAAKYGAICKRRGKKIAIVAIARMIAEIAYRLLRDGTVFDEEKLALG